LGSAVTVNLGTNTATGSDAAGDKFYGIEGIIGSNAGDTLTGSSGDDYLSGGNGSTAGGSDGADGLYGSLGNDTYRFGLGGGHDSVVDQYYTTETYTIYDGKGNPAGTGTSTIWSDAGQDVLELGDGITLADILAQLSSANLVVTLRDSGIAQLVRRTLAELRVELAAVTALAEPSRVYFGEARGRGVLLLLPEPGLQAAKAFPRGVEAGRGHVAPRAGVVAGLRRARARGQEPLHAIEVLGRAREVGLRAHDLGLGLADVLDARAGASQAQLGLGLGAVGPGRGEGELGVGRVDAGDLLADGDGGPFVDREPLQRARDLGGDEDLGGLDVAGGGDETGVVGLAAGAGRRGGEGEGEGEGGETDTALHARAPLRRGRDGGPCGASPRRVSSSR